MHLMTYTRASLFLSMFVVLGGSAACEAGQMPSLDEAGDGSSSGGSSLDGSDDSSGLDDSETWEPDSPPDHVTEHLEIWDFGPEELCAGQIATMEREVVRLSDEMGLSVQGLRLAWGAAATEELCSRPFPIDGCAGSSGPNTYIATNARSASHELVHGIRKQNELQTHAFFEEAIAVHLGTDRPHSSYLAWQPPSLDDFGPTSLLQYSGSDFYAGNALPGDFYTLAAHYLTFLREAHGTDALMSFLRRVESSNVDQAFYDAFGLSIEDSEMDWRNDAPPIYELGDPCREMLEFGSTGIVLEQNLSCELEGTVSYVERGLGTNRGYCFDLADSTSVEISLEVDDGSVTFLAHECWGVPVGSPTPSERVTHLTTPETVSLAGCRWKIQPVVAQPGGSFRLTITPIE